MRENSASLAIERCPGCSCGIPSQSSICDYCLAVLSFGSDGRWVVDGRVCAACGAESSLNKAACPRCQAPRTQGCPSCGLEAMPLDAPRCPNCHAYREEFFDVCVQEAARRQRKIDKEMRMKPRIMVMGAAASAALMLALGWHNGDFESLRGTLVVVFLASVFLVIGLLPLVKK